MPDGDFRRAPRLPEQQILARIDAANAGVMGSSVASVVPSEPSPTPGGTGSDQEPPYYADIDTDVPAAPNVAQVIAGLAVTWTGTDTAGDPYPPGIHAEIHVSAASGFTPLSSTLKGTLALPGTLTVSGLTAGTDYYAVIVVVDEQGETAQSAQSGPVSAGFVTTTAIGTGTITEDLVSFDATAIGGIQQFVGTGTPSTSAALGSTWVNTSNGSYNVLEDVAGTPTWVQRQWDSDGIAADAITSTQIAAGAVIAESIAAQAITSKLVSGEVIRTSTADSGARVRLSSTDGIEVYSSSGRVFHASPSGTVTISGYATTGDISSFITGSEVNSNVTSISGDSITSGTITGRTISGGSIIGTTISGGTITGTTVQTSSSSTRAVLGSGAAATLDFYYFGTLRGFVTGYDAGLSLYGNPKVNVLGDLQASGSITNSSNVAFGSSGGNVAFRVDASGNVYSYGIDANTTTNAPNVRIGASATLLKSSTSTERVKTAMSPLRDDLPGVDPSKIGTEPASVDPYDVLNVVPTEFQSLCPADESQRLLGFIAENVADAFPWGAEWDDEGLPSAVSDRPILAALLQVVKEQQSIITDLTARVEALEG